jgi:iron complex outermembrane receptor protein
MRQGNISTGKAFLIPQYRLYTGAAYISEVADLGPVVLSGGVRYEYRWQHVYEFTDAGIDVPDETRSYDGVAASFGVTVPVGDAWSVSGTTGRGWRAPNVSERYSQGIHHGTAQYELGDRSLVTERTWNVDATVKRQGLHLDLQVSAYRNAIENFIYLEPRAPVLTIRGAYPAFAFAQANSVVAGLEGSVNVRPARPLELRASGSLVRGTDRATDGPLYDMPADRFQIGMRLDLPAPSWAAGSFVDVGLTTVLEQTRVPESIVYALPTDGYRLVDVSAGVDHLDIGGQRAEVSLEVKNVFDASYRDYLSRYKLFVDDPGRDIVLRVWVPLGATY